MSAWLIVGFPLRQARDRHPSLDLEYSSISPPKIVTKNVTVFEGIKLKILKVEDILLDRMVMAREWDDPQAHVQAEMLMYAHYDEMDWPYVHRQASQIGVLKIMQEIQKKVKRRVKRK